MSVELTLISGVAVGLEFVETEEGRFFVLDLLIVRLLFVL